ncbi:MAG: CoB--CoM heterodisulfide reductase iron-sulfur subunit A family protein, partial [Deltaproteobacteria bacterium]|nr:CoB--CoM heterodisulfide reductase iron-sulfur subunit A family protein [Deltaproteobacteria bacterium]
MAAKKIGVYICHCGVNIAHTVDIEEIRGFAAGLPHVKVSENYMYMCSEPGQEQIRKDIREKGLNRIVVAACSPRMHEPTFRGALQSAGLNPYCLEIANIREHCAWVHKDKAKGTAKAKSLIAAAVAKVALVEPLEEREVDVTKTALVVGGGIAGIQAALDIADTGFKTYLVEKDPSIGGHMMQLDKTFPTLDCSACILTPKMADIKNHPNIELLAFSEVEEVSGFVGNFKVKVKKKPRYIDEAICNACGSCATYCSIAILDKFNEGFSKLQALHIPFPQAIPAAYFISEEECRYLKEGTCRQCEQVCKELNAINLDMQEEIVELDVGTIIVATGFQTFDPAKKPELGYTRYENVITGMEFERIVSASGPNQGELLISGQKPKEVVFIQCVGSRDKTVGNEHCSRVCCMYTAKHAHLVKEKLPDARVTIFYIDVRAFGKGYEEFYDRVKGEGVYYRRGNVSEIYKKGDKLICRAEDTLQGVPVEVPADLVVLAVGMEPSDSSKQLGKLMKLSNSADSFFLEAHPKLRPVDTGSDGVFLAGCCQGPKDIPDTVAQAGAAAAKAVIPLARGKVKTETMVAKVRV